MRGVAKCVSTAEPLRTSPHRHWFHRARLDVTENWSPLRLEHLMAMRPSRQTEMLSPEPKVSETTHLASRRFQTKFGFHRLERGKTVLDEQGGVIHFHLSELECV